MCLIETELRLVIKIKAKTFNYSFDHNYIEWRKKIKSFWADLQTWSQSNDDFYWHIFFNILTFNDSQFLSAPQLRCQIQIINFCFVVHFLFSIFLWFDALQLLSLTLKYSHDLLHEHSSLFTWHSSEQEFRELQTTILKDRI